MIGTTRKRKRKRKRWIIKKAMFNKMVNKVKQWLCRHNQTTVDNRGVRFCIKCKQSIYKIY